MSRQVATRPIPSPGRHRVPPLENGDQLDQRTFHARYEATPDGVRAELIGGVVHMPSPAGRPHARGASHINHWLSSYEDATPGTEVLAGGTVMLGPLSEPEPDVFLRILPERGGGTWDSRTDEYVHGAPELVVEVAMSSESIDLHGKKEDYERAGVDEYVVLLLRQRRVRWFALDRTATPPVYRLLEPDADGILKSHRFPGLWLEPEAIAGGDMRRVLRVLECGLASPEHQEWVERLASAQARARRKAKDTGGG